MPNMPKRNPNRRRKSSRKTHTQNSNHVQTAYQQQHTQTGTTYVNSHMPCFSEDSIQRQLAYMVPVPVPVSTPASGGCYIGGQEERGMRYGGAGYEKEENGENGANGVNGWEAWDGGYWYTYTHPVTFEDVVVWGDGRYAYMDDLGSYCQNNDGDGNDDSSYENENYDDENHATPRTTCSPPSFTYIEGYHDPILKDQTEDWWRLFGHDVPAEFILSRPLVNDLDENPRDVDKKGGREVTWDVAAYFAPLGRSGVGAGRGVEGMGCYGESGEDVQRYKEGIIMGETVDGVERKCRGRDEWDCEFCGLECFCWMVEGDGSEMEN